MSEKFEQSHEKIQKELYDTVEQLLRRYVINSIILYFEIGHELLSSSLVSKEYNGNTKIENIITLIDSVKEKGDEYLKINSSENIQKLVNDFGILSERFKKSLVDVVNLNGAVVSKEKMVELEENTVPLYQTMLNMSEFLKI